MSKQLAPIMRGYVRKSNHSLYGTCWHSECRQPTRFFATTPFVDRHDFAVTRSQAIQQAINDAHELQRPAAATTLASTASLNAQPATINCPKCNGAGCQHDVPPGQPVHGGDIYECYHCEGTGQVPAN